ncbi:hypothetical protein K501DRAFT_280427 [Backusella circina FSU 941]|nr:hypothetical protein K501DRAFT_280427 [Backusella circina FSU 941]
MFSVPCSVSPLQLEKRRSKSLDDLKIKTEYHCNNNNSLDCYKDIAAPVSPIVIFDLDKTQKSKLPKRRHSLSAEPSSTEYLRLAKIYGWTTTKDTTDNTANSLHSPSLVDSEYARKK